MQLTPLFTIEVSIDAVLTAGKTPIGEVRLLPFAQGSFEGPDLRGKLLPGGTDWQQIRDDGVIEIRAHYLLETGQSEVIEVVSEGIRAAPVSVLERLNRGEKVPSNEYYFRTHMRFRTAAKRLDHLNRVLAVSHGERQGNGVRLQVFAVP
jgi:hypothetical protein